MDEEQHTRELTLRLAERILAAHEVLARRAERRPVVIEERYYCPLTGDHCRAAGPVGRPTADREGAT